MAKKKKQNKQRNVVHKYAWELNKSQPFTDRKKAKKKGYQKHKSRQVPLDDFCACTLHK